MSATGSTSSSSHDGYHFSGLNERFMPSEGSHHDTSNIDNTSPTGAAGGNNDADNAPIDRLSNQASGIQLLLGRFPSAYAHFGQGRLWLGGMARGSNLKSWTWGQKTSGLSDAVLRKASRVDLDFKTSACSYDALGLQLPQQGFLHGPTRAKPKVRDSQLTATFKTPYGVDIRPQVNWNSTSRSYDPATEKTVFPDLDNIIEDNSGLQTPLPDGSNDHIWVDEGEQYYACNLLVMSSKDWLPTWMTDRLNPSIKLLGDGMERLAPWMSHVMHITANVSAQAACMLSLNGNLRGSVRKHSSRRRVVSDEELERNLRKSVLDNASWKRTLLDKEVFKHFVNAWIDEWIICPERYNADGEIPHWTGRIYAAYVLGDDTRMHRSPYFINKQAPGEGQSFSRTGLMQGGVTLQMMFAKTVLDFLRMLPGGAALEAHLVRWMPKSFQAVRIKINLDCNPALNLSKEKSIKQTADSVTQAGSKCDITTTKTSCSVSSLVETSAAINVNKRFIGATGIKQMGYTQNLTCIREYKSSTSGGPKSNPQRDVPNDAMDALRHNVYETGALAVDMVAADEAEALAAFELRKRIDEANATCINAVTGQLEREDKAIIIEGIFTCPHTSRVGRFALAPQVSGRIYDTRANVQSGYRATANNHEDAGIKTELQCFARTSAEKILPRPNKEFIEVRSAVRKHEDGSDAISSISIDMQLVFAENHTAQEVDDTLAKFGNLYRNHLPFHRLPSIDAVMEAPYLPPVSRNICFTANLLPQQLDRLRLALSNGQALDKAKSYKLKSQDILDLKEAGFSEAHNTRSTIFALGEFICRQEEPAEALKCLRDICGGSWFDLHKDSDVGTTDRLAREVADLQNTLRADADAQLEPWARLTQRLATIEKMLRRVTFVQNRPKDPFTSASWDKKHRIVQQQIKEKLWALSAYCKAGMGAIGQAPHDVDISLSQHLSATGIVTEADWLAAQHIDHATHLRLETEKLSRAHKSHLTVAQREKLRVHLKNMQHDLAALDNSHHALPQSIKTASAA